MQIVLIVALAVAGLLVGTRPGSAAVVGSSWVEVPGSGHMPDPAFHPVVALANRGLYAFGGANTKQVARVDGLLARGTGLRWDPLGRPHAELGALDVHGACGLDGRYILVVSATATLVYDTTTDAWLPSSTPPPQPIDRPLCFAPNPTNVIVIGSTVGSTLAAFAVSVDVSTGASAWQTVDPFSGVVQPGASPISLVHDGLGLSSATLLLSDNTVVTVSATARTSALVADNPPSHSIVVLNVRNTLYALSVGGAVARRNGAGLWDLAFSFASVVSGATNFNNIAQSCVVDQADFFLVLGAPPNMVLRADTVSQGQTVVVPVGELPPDGLSEFSADAADASHVVVFGGRLPSGDLSAGTYLFSPTSTPSWRMARTDIRPAARYGHSTNVGPQGVFVYGGRSATAGVCHGDIWLYQSRSSQWARLGDSDDVLSNEEPVPRSDAATILLSSTELIMYGGQCGGVLLNDLWRFDIPTQTWSVLKDDDSRPQLPRLAAAVITAPLNDTSLAILGGADGTGGVNLEIITVDLLTLDVHRVALNPSNTLVRNQHSAVRLSTGVLVAGGYTLHRTYNYEVVVVGAAGKVLRAATPQVRFPSYLGPAAKYAVIEERLFMFTGRRTTAVLQFEHTLGCPYGTVASGTRCVPCPIGFYHNTTANQCVRCDLNLTTLVPGASDMSVCLPIADLNPVTLPVQRFSSQPTFHQSRARDVAQDSEQATLIGLCVTGFVILVIGIMMRCCSRNAHDKVFKNMDLLFDESHHIKAGPMIKRETVCGGIFFYIFVCVVVTLLYRASRDYALDNLEEVTNLVPINVVPPEIIVGDVTLRGTFADYWGPCNCDNVVIKYPPTFTFTEVTTSCQRITELTIGNITISAAAAPFCSVTVTFTLCNIISRSLQEVEIQLREAQASAAAVYWQVASKSGRWPQTSTVGGGVAAAGGRVYRGLHKPLRVAVRVFPELMDDSAVGWGMYTGHAVHIISEAEGDTVDQDSYQSLMYTGVTYQLAPSDTLLALLRRNKQDIIVLLATLAGLFGGMFGIFTVLSKGGEKLYYVYLTHQEEQERSDQSFFRNLWLALSDVFAQLEDDPYDKRKKIGPKKLTFQQLEDEKAHIELVIESVIEALPNQDLVRSPDGSVSLSFDTFMDISRSVLGENANTDQLRQIFDVMDSDKSQSLEISEISEWMMSVLFNPNSNLALSDASATLLQLQFFANMIICSVFGANPSVVGSLANLKSMRLESVRSMSMRMANSSRSQSDAMGNSFVNKSIDGVTHLQVPRPKEIAGPMGAPYGTPSNQENRSFSQPLPSPKRKKKSKLAQVVENDRKLAPTAHPQQSIHQPRSPLERLSAYRSTEPVPSDTESDVSQDGYIQVLPVETTWSDTDD